MNPRTLALLLLAISILIPKVAFARDPLKQATANYLITYLLVDSLRAGECGKLLALKPAPPEGIAKTFDLAKPYLNAKEREQFRTGQLQREMRQSIEPLTIGIRAEANKIGKTDREICLFSIAFAVGRMQGFRDTLRDLGGPAL